MNKKGNIIIVVVCIVVALMGSLGYLLKNTTTRMYTTKKIGSTLYARELANTLAKLSIRYLNQRLIDQNDEFCGILSLPLDKFKDSGAKDLLPRIKTITKTGDNLNILEFIASKSGLKNLKIEKLYWEVYKDDFKPIDVNGKNPYTREKYGLVHIFMNFSYVQPGKKDSEKERSKESYHFVSDVNVVANIIPVLSRFSLYIDDALDGNKEDLERFNVVNTNANGTLNSRNSNSYIPWVLNNHGKGYGVDKNLKSYNKIIESSRGLVFLGGGSFGEVKGIRLGLTFGETGKGSEFGEGFQFFYTDETGYWKNQASKEDFDAWGGNVGILTANFGLCNEPEKEQSESDNNSFNPEDDDDFEDDDYNTYFDYVGGSNADKYSSIFKLYGTDENPSPTLVLGYVDAKYAAVKQFRFGEEDFEYDILANYSTVPEFKEASSYDYDSAYEAEEGEEDDKDSLYDDDLTDFAFRYRKVHSKRLELATYLQNFSSKIELDSYNKGYSYALNNGEEFPFKNNLLEGDELKRLFKKNDQNIFIDVPNTKDANYNSIYPETKLGEIGKFLDLNKLNINDIEKGNKNYRIAHSLKFTSYEPENKSIDCFYTKDTEKDFIKYLKTKGILINDKLNLNGWLFINNEADTDLVLNLNNIKVVSRGGIILSNGNLHIKSDILSDTNDNKKFLTIITLGDNKDIIVDEKVNKLDASLISKDGQVKLIGRGNIKSLEINGNMIMKKIQNGDQGLKAMMRGVRLNYNLNLSAIPFKSSDEENNLLMFNLKDNPKILK